MLVVGAVGKRETGTVFRFSISSGCVENEAALAFGVKTEIDRAEVEDPDAIGDGREGDGLADQGFAEKEPLTLPFDLAAAAHAAELHGIWIFDLGEPSGIGPRGGCVQTSWWRPAEGLVGTDAVVVVEEGVELLLMRSAVGAGISACALFESSMHPFVAAVLLRFTGLD